MKSLSQFTEIRTLTSHEDFAQFEAKAKPYFDRLEKVCARSLTPPDWFFKLSQRKIQKGDYIHDYDLDRQSQSPKS